MTRKLLAMKVQVFGKLADTFMRVCANIGGHNSVEKSMPAANKKINANFLFGGFIASYESW